MTPPTTLPVCKPMRIPKSSPVAFAFASTISRIANAMRTTRRAVMPCRRARALALIFAVAGLKLRVATAGEHAVRRFTGHEEIARAAKREAPRAAFAALNERNDWGVEGGGSAGSSATSSCAHSGGHQAVDHVGCLAHRLIGKLPRGSVRGSARGSVRGSARGSVWGSVRGSGRVGGSSGSQSSGPIQSEVS